jgi:hypothetical protein
VADLHRLPVRPHADGHRPGTARGLCLHPAVRPERADTGVLDDRRQPGSGSVRAFRYRARGRPHPPHHAQPGPDLRLRTRTHRQPLRDVSDAERIPRQLHRFRDVPDVDGRQCADRGVRARSRT